MKKTNTSNPLKFFNDNKDKAYKKAGGEMAAFKKSLKRMDNGGGSGMGRMAKDDAAFDAMMNPSTASPSTSSFPSPESARLLLAAQAAKDAMTMQGSGSQNVNIANAARLAEIGNEPPVMGKPPGVREENLGDWHKKGGSVRRKK
jgi:hypothetical protein